MRAIRGQPGKVAGTISTRMFIVLIGGVTSVVVSRQLHPDGRGEYALIVAVATLTMALGHLSVEQAQVYLWSRSADRRTLAANASAIGLATGCAAAAIAWIIAVLLLPGAVAVEERSLLAVSLLYVPIATVVMYVNGLLILDNRVGRVNVGVLLAAILQCSMLLILSVAFRLTVGWVVVIWTASTALPLFVTLGAFGERPRHVSLPLAKATVLLGLRYHLGMASLYLLFRVDVLMLGRLVTKFDVGLYSLAVTIAELTYILTNAIAHVAMPYQVSATFSKAGRSTVKLARTTFVVSLGTVAAVVLAGGAVIPAVFGQEFSGSVAPLIALAPGVVALATARAISPYLVRSDQPKVMTLATTGAMVANIVLNLLMIPVWGIVGSAIASSIAYALLGAFYAGWLCRVAGLPAAALSPRLSDVMALSGLVRSVGRSKPPIAQEDL